jgi:N-acetylmuramoyl-L-alanine amidase
MSATPNRADWNAGLSAPGLPLQEGNRVLESIARQEGLRALLGFAGLHEQIRNRPPDSGGSPDWDLFQTERFVLDEVLQLVCNRAHALTHADGIILALAEGSALVCRATAGSLPIPRSFGLNPHSPFLRDCLQSGKIVRCDDSTIDPRVEFDFTRKLGGRSIVLVPLRGRRDCLGVLQAFATTPRALTDEDIRSLDLFAELILAALRPEDQDRRFHWLSDVASDVLQAKPSQSVPIAMGNLLGEDVIELAEMAPAKVAFDRPVPDKAEHLGSRHRPDLVDASSPESAANAEPELVRSSESATSGSSFSRLGKDSVLGLSLPEEPLHENVPHGSILKLSVSGAEARSAGDSEGGRGRWGFGARPGLSVVLGLMAVAALFSAGVWWGMRVHARDLGIWTTASRAGETPVGTKAISTPTTATSAGANSSGLASSSGDSSANADNLMDPNQLAEQPSVLVPVPEGKLAALPKITGVRHWTSSAGSTVVIDMEDQVPYEVHRLMSPARIYFDLHDTVLAQELAGKTIDVEDTALAKVRVGQPVAGVTRVVLDTDDGSNFSVSMETNPYRLVVELRGNGTSVASKRFAPSESVAAKPAPDKEIATAAPTPPIPAKTGKFRIVLDAGHGGWDLGTVGRQGLLEKDLVLDVTQRLGKLLRSRLGLEVMLTRNGDEYLPLDQRADFANQAQADLFVSVHANYSSLATARGVETYYTNLFSAPGFKEIEKHSNGNVVPPTPVTLSAAGLHERVEESRRLAGSVQRSLYAALAAKSPDIRDRGIKDASFVVLTGTTMPSILTEISFVSSPADEHNLQSESYRQQIAEALYKGIARYQETSSKTKVAQLGSVGVGR